MQMQMWGNVPPLAYHSPRLTSGTGPIGPPDALALVQPRPRVPYPSGPLNRRLKNRASRQAACCNSGAERFGVGWCGSEVVRAAGANAGIGHQGSWLGWFTGALLAPARDTQQDQEAQDGRSSPSSPAQKMKSSASPPMRGSAVGAWKHADGRRCVLKCGWQRLPQSHRLEAWRYAQTLKG